MILRDFSVLGVSVTIFPPSWSVVLVTRIRPESKSTSDQ